jgi:hypothetical protein
MSPPPRVLSLAVLALALLPTQARAHPWMIRHGYQGCGLCHQDPSGAGLLTAYGRAQSELVLASRFGTRAASEEASRASQFVLGLVPLPDWLLLGVSYRGAELLVRSETVDAAGNHHVSSDARYVQMVADLRAGLRLSRFRAAVTVGWAPGKPSPVSLSRNPTQNVTSREHWLGWTLGEDESGLLRAGRIPLPFGLRNVEHTSWVRVATGTDVDKGQQHGLALALTAERVRGELMLIVGNLQLSPDVYRERGFAGYVETMLGTSVALGFSSKVTRVEHDLTSGSPALNQAHGLFMRWVIQPRLALLAEADGLFKSILGTGRFESGGVAWAQLDWEPWQGLHLMPALETWRQYGDGGTAAFGEWVTVDWFVHSHVELRLDVIFRQIPPSRGASSSIVGLAQVRVLL